MTGSKIIFNLLIAAVVLVLLFFGYKFLMGGGDATDVTGGEEAGLTAAGFASDTAEGSAADEFLATLTGLQELNLRGEIFANPVFQDLQESAIVLPDQTPGRPNPFAPVNFSNLSSSNKTATSTPANKTSTSTGSSLDSLRGN